MATFSLPMPAMRAAHAAAAAIFSAVRAAALGVWRFLEAVGSARAASELSAVADSIQASDPELAARLRRGPANHWL